MAAPLLPSANNEAVIRVPLLMEQPYAEMTLRWMRERGIQWKQDEMKEFRISGGQCYTPFDAPIAADFSSATFFFCAAALTGSTLLLKGLDMEDSQGDKAVLSYLEAMGCSVRHLPEGIELDGSTGLRGAVLDLNDTPDALPAMVSHRLLCIGRDPDRQCSTGPYEGDRPHRRYDGGAYKDGSPY